MKKNICHQVSLSNGKSERRINVSGVFQSSALLDKLSVICTHAQAMYAKLHDQTRYIFKHFSSLDDDNF
uniref:Uncharacterized protein n=1 Tax=Anguilla anguilla TaxID=7936 RepID=A0A0E9WJD1_ANGAN